MLVKFKKGSFFSILLIAVPIVSLSLLIFGWPFAPDLDLYVHLKCGELIWKTFGFITTDVLTFTANHGANEFHSWLSQVIFYKLFVLFGPFSLKLLNLIIALLAMSSALSFIWKETKRFEGVCLGGILFVLLHSEVQMIRPHLWGELFFCFHLFSILSNATTLSNGKVILSFVTGVLWINLHGSGLILPVFYLLFAFFQWLSRREKLDENKMSALALLSILSPFWIGLSLLIQPRGIHLFGESIGLVRVAKSTLIVEWLPKIPFYQSWRSPNFIVDFVSVVQTVVVIFLIFQMCRLKNMNQKFAYHLAVAFTCLVLSFLAIRNIIYLVWPLMLMVSRIKWPQIRLNFLRFGTVIFSIYLFVFSNCYSMDIVFPSIEKTVKFMEDVGFKGNLLNYPEWGGYLSWKLYPNILIAYDRRLSVHSEFIEKESRMVRRGQLSELWIETVKNMDSANLLVLPSSLERVLKVLPELDWIRVYENNQASVWLRRKDTENLKKVYEYYAFNRVPFNEEDGFRPLLVFESRREWFDKNREVLDLGFWPNESLREFWEKQERRYTFTRGLKGMPPQ